MTELEKNRLIESFMGWELKFITDYDLNQWCFANKRLGKIECGVYNESERPYCTDWNELMQALNFFDNLEEFDRLDLSINERKCWRQHCDNINFAVTTYCIDEAVNALCEGIEWYNSIKND